MKKLEKFLKTISYKPSPFFGKGVFISNEITHDKDDNLIVNIVLEYEKILPIKEVIAYQKKTREYKHGIKTIFKVKNVITELDVVHDYLRYILKSNEHIFGNTLKHNDILIGDELKIKTYSSQTLRD
jgi:hypothetical protein